MNCTLFLGKASAVAHDYSAVEMVELQVVDQVATEEDQIHHPESLGFQV